MTSWPARVIYAQVWEHGSQQQGYYQQKKQKDRKVIAPLLSDRKCFSHSLEVLKTCSQPSFLYAELSRESCYMASGFVGDSPPMASGVSLLSSYSLHLLKSNHLLFLFLELFVLWRNNGFAFMSCKCGPSSISQIFLFLVLPSVFHTLARLDRGSPAPCSLQWPQKHVGPAFPREDGPGECSRARSSRENFTRLSIFLLC